MVRAHAQLPGGNRHGYEAVFYLFGHVYAGQILQVRKPRFHRGRHPVRRKRELLSAVTALGGSGRVLSTISCNTSCARAEMGLDEHVILHTWPNRPCWAPFTSSAAPTNALDELIRAVASKGGTTETALHTFATMRVWAKPSYALKQAEQRARGTGARRVKNTAADKTRERDVKCFQECLDSVYQYCPSVQI